MEGSKAKSSFLNVSYHKFNPRNWSKRTTRVVYAVLLTILLPLYACLYFQHTAAVEASDYPTLEIPGINLSTPVQSIKMENRQLHTPDEIAGSYSQADNKLLIIGHSSTVFKKLDRVKVNDNFTYDGQTYRVTTLSTLEKAKISMRELLSTSEEDTIIIMTCAGEPLPNQDATHRLIVTAVKVGE